MRPTWRQHARFGGLHLALLLGALVVVLAFGASPASAAPALSQLQVGSSAGAEDYMYTAGDGIYGSGTASANRGYRFKVLDSSGTVRGTSSCGIVPAGGAVNWTYNVQTSDPVSNNTAWTYVLAEYNDWFCFTGETDSSLYFTVAKATTYADAALTTPKSSFGSSDTVYLTAAGVGVVKTSPTQGASADWNTTWLNPSGGTSCANTLSSDRPDVTINGTLPNSAGSYLKYRPDAAGGGAAWNDETKYETRPCAALSTGSNDGLWQVTLQKDATHFVTMDAFTFDEVPPAPTITSSPATPGNDTTPTWAATTSGPTLQCKLDKGATPISGWATCTSPQTYDVSASGDGSYTFSTRGLSPLGTPGPVATSNYDLDATAPAAPTVTGPTTPGSGASPSWSFSGEAGGTYSCQLDRGGTVISAWASCTSAKSYSL
ncbi:MAG: hypothetical protein QOF37_2213, partial [Thermoleophilaceae bacterium]|nr:hypothetical protein [Thermoleophilaceae bacterium]